MFEIYGRDLPFSYFFTFPVPLVELVEVRERENDASFAVQGRGQLETEVVIFELYRLDRAFCQLYHCWIVCL